MSTEPKLDWVKSSYQHYVARPHPRVTIEVVRSGRAKLMNYTWHPVVFGNRWASNKEFKNRWDAMVEAEALARQFVREMATSWWCVEEGAA